MRKHKTEKLSEMDLEVIKNFSLLYVEDDLQLHRRILEFLGMHFDRVYSAHDGVEGLQMFKRHQPDVVLTDVRMPGMDGLEMCGKIKEISPDTPLIIISAFSDTEYLMKAIEIGVDKYVRKPTDGDKLLEAIYKSALPRAQEKEIESLSEELTSSLESQVSRSESMKEVLKQIQKVAKSDFSIIICGETGVGKTYLARIIHDLSRRASRPFVAVDIGAIPETLIERELFGHTRGAFTGAHQSKKGYFETANGGTLLLEDLENLTPYVQSKLLRAVEEKKVYPIGSTTAVDVNIRIVGTTNKDIHEEVKKGEFREDLFYRLCEFEVDIPPLRERVEDIPMLAQKFVNEVAGELDRQITGLSEGAVDILEKHQWKGNVREIKNLIRRSVLLSETDEIGVEDVNAVLALSREPGGAFPADMFKEGDDYSMSHAVEQAEVQAIRRALKKTGGKKVKAAAMLKVDYKTLQTKIEKLGIK